MQSNIRNFCIIAHIDHGKSTLADRFLELTRTVEERKMKQQLLDTMELEQERGITIKLQPVRMKYDYKGKNYFLNLIDTPGHVDFNYEVSRTLASVEGAILLVDAVKGIQAQTLSNLYLALEQDLTIIPVINKIDLPNARTKQVEAEIKDLLGQNYHVYNVSAKTGQNVTNLLEKVIEKIPLPNKALKNKKKQGGLVFDSFYDDYKGVIAAVRLFSGKFQKGDQIEFGSKQIQAEIKDLGYFKPWLKLSQNLVSGEIGYIVTGLKDLEKVKVGDTVYNIDNKSKKMLSDFKEPKPVVFASVFPQEGENYDEFKQALSILNLSDSSLQIKPEFSTILGRGFRLGLLGRLHLEIVKERLKRESNMEIIVTKPSVAYNIVKTNNKKILVRRAGEMPNKELIKESYEPWTKVEIISPLKYKGEIFTLLNNLRAEFLNEIMIGRERINMQIKMPLLELLTNFHDNLKSISSGYASFSYEGQEMRQADLVRMDVLVAQEKIEPFSQIVLKDNVYKQGKKLVESLKNLIPRQNFQVAIQAVVGGTIIARSNIKAYRKDVTAKLYGGDYSRKQKLLTKQKKGKKKMNQQGKVQIPSDVFLKAAIE